MPKWTKWSLIGANLLIPISLLTFALGFFPYKPFLPGLAQYDTHLYPSQPDAPFDKVIFMVVDALRSDFVYSQDTGFKFVQSLIRQGSALPFTAHATSPTITMPRIKAITTGSTPSFLDLILNFAESDTSSSLATQDTWLAQMRAKQAGKLVMYGDDTWLKLFPDTFDRAEGTSSFFVADFTEVDANVTRHVPRELKNADWNTMVLHYLGLDHIGHKTGPRSPFMMPKQIEMDSIIETIYKAIQTEDHLQSTLLILAGDHGMNDAGNHGGSAPGETSPALVFASPKINFISSGQKSPLPIVDDFQYHSRVQQSDIAPTLAGLLGFPIPKNNLGVIITDMLPFWSKDDQSRLLGQNANQLLAIVKAASPKAFYEEESTSLECTSPSSEFEELACDWRVISRLNGQRSTQSAASTQQLIEVTSKWCQNAQQLMSGAASNYDMTKLISGLLLAISAFILAFIAALPTLSPNILASLPFLTICTLYGILMFASSYVEEEHQFWYWATSGWLVYLFIKGVNRYQKNRDRQRAMLDSFGAITALIALRICRRWNQTGQKFAGEPDIARSFLTQHNVFLWLLVTLTYVWPTYHLARSGFPSLHRAQASALAFALFVLTMNFKIAFTAEDAPELMIGLTPYRLGMLSRCSGKLDLVSSARVVFAALGGCFAYVLLASLISPAPTAKYRKATRETIGGLLILLLYTQTRTASLPLYSIFLFLKPHLHLYLDPNSHSHPSLLTLTTTHLLLSHTTHSNLGLNNAISSIDLSLAYNGISSYNAPLVSVLCFLSNFSGPIFILLNCTTPILISYKENQLKKFKLRYSSMLSPSILRKKERKVVRAIWQQWFALLTFATTLEIVGVMAACTLLRTHLFVWTVFSPRFLWAVAWGCLVQGVVWGVLGAGGYLLGE